MPAAATLPDKPSALIRVALADLAKAEADPRYRVEMCEWHRPIADGVCEICLAGAVMAGTLGAHPGRFAAPTDFGDPAARLLCALDDFRVGDVAIGLREMGLELPTNMRPDWPVAFYEDSPTAFRADMERLASDLEAAGL